MNTTEQPTAPITLETLQNCGDKEKFPFELQTSSSDVYAFQPQAHLAALATVHTSRRAHNWKLTRRDIYFNVPTKAGGYETWHGVLFGEGNTFKAKPVGRARARRAADLARRRAAKAEAKAKAQSEATAARPTDTTVCSRCHLPTDHLTGDLGLCYPCNDLVSEAEA